MKKSITITIIFFLIMIADSCSSNQKQILKANADELAQLECRAMQLREERFALANAIRGIEDSMANATTTKNDTMVFYDRLVTLNSAKQLLLTKTLQLSDTIKNKMDVVMEDFLKDKTSRTEFNKLLDEALKVNGCK